MGMLIAAFMILVSLAVPASAQPVATLGNAELFSRQYVQAVTVSGDKSNPSFYDNQNALPRKRKIKSSSIFKTAISSGLCGAGGGLAGMGMGVLILTGGTGATKGGMDGLGVAIAATVFGGGLGAIMGCSAGAYFVGKQYRQGSYWHALAGTVLPSLATAGVTKLLSDGTHFNAKPTLIAASLAPITSTVAYYIFSEELPDTIR